MLNQSNNLNHSAQTFGAFQVNPFTGQSPVMEPNVDRLALQELWSTQLLQKLAKFNAKTADRHQLASGLEQIFFANH